MATKIKHVAIRTTSTEKAKLMADFYGTLFGMNRDNRTTDGYVWASLGSRGWAKVGSIPHLHTWSLTTCMVDGQPTVIDYPQTSTERAELEAFADAIARGTPYACPPAEAVHGVAVLEAIVRSTRSGRREPID